MPTTINHTLTALKKYWGYDSFLNLQQEAIECVLENRDSIVVLPTGGGKSICFQAPALQMEGMAVVVSPLISLMKDQVDSLVFNGISAKSLNSSLGMDEQWEIEQEMLSGKLKILYVSPERLVTSTFRDLLKRANVSFFAIDEAHCISAWGHDFRPEYKALGSLKKIFPNAAVHAYTATATKLVRNDIAAALNLSSPEILTGKYDRPNLIYSVKRADNRMSQVCAVIDRHRSESGIIYCIKRKDVDKVCEELKELGYSALPYHAGLNSSVRQHNQDAFIKDRTDIIVATIAFGMGIDKSNVRYVIHSGMPKSLENYQQESGRAGRDGLPADCLLLHSSNDFGTWSWIINNGDGESGEAALKNLYNISNYCSSIECRHRLLVNYFGQEYDSNDCQACDVCLNDLKLSDHSLEVGQKILSCIKRLNEMFGADYISKVLTGSRDQRILEWKHDKVSTYGMLSEFNKRQVRDWIEQLVGQGYIAKDPEFGAMTITSKGWLIIRGEDTPKLLKPAVKQATTRDRSSKGVDARSWEGVDRDLFGKLRMLRLDIATEKNVPAFIIFGDASLRDMARMKPTTVAAFKEVYGVGDQKSKEYAARFTQLIAGFVKG